MDSKMNEIYIKEGTAGELRIVYELLRRDFTPEELKDYRQLESLISKGKYKMLLANHKESNALTGFACIYEIEETNALWLDYIAVDVQFRNSGYGSALFNSIAGYKKDEGSLAVFLEVEIPEEEDGPEQEIQKRRIRFYERNGAARLPVDYHLPTKEGSMPMYLFFKPAGNLSILPEAKINQAITSALGYIHTDIPHTSEIIRKATQSI